MAEKLVNVKLSEKVVTLMKELKHPGQSYNGFILEVIQKAGVK